MSNAKGRLAEAYTCTGSCTSKITDTGYGYTARGEISDIYQSSPNSGGYYHASEQYWPNGARKQLSGLPTLPTFTYGVDGEGRMNALSASTGQNPLAATSYNAASLPTTLTFGSGDSDSFTYDPNTLRMTQYQFNVNGQLFTGVLGWNADGTLASQNITDPFHSADTQNCSYSHDDVERLASVNCGAATWQQNFSYDPFGNITKTVPTGGTGSSLQPTYSSATNQMTSLPGFTPTYDANGNVLTNSAHTYTWDADGHYASVDGIGYTFDAFGRLVELVISPSYQLFYLPDGSQVGFQSQVARRGELNLPGGARVNYDSTSGGLLNYEHPDHLRSLRLITTPSRTYSDSLAYAPFGETYAVSSLTPDQAFTGMNSHGGGLDTFSFPDRVYSNQGRWVSPDPAGLASMHLNDPQTLNRYAYVRNNPLALIDPLGLDEVDACGDPEEDCAGESGGGGSTGGDPASGGDPTSGGDPGNSGSDCTGDPSLCGGSQNPQDPQSQVCDPGTGMCVPVDTPPPPPPPNPSGTCVYLNAAGTAPDANGGIDPNSNAAECAANNGPGGFFVAGVTLSPDSRITVNPDTLDHTVLLSVAQCNQIQKAANRINAILGGSAPIFGAAAKQVPGAGGAAGAMGIGIYVNNQSNATVQQGLCGGPGL
jgi:RHS repeat-associated protein